MSEIKFLEVWSNVVLNPLIEKVILALEPHFEKANVKSCVTSGIRTPEDQLRIIRDYLKKTKLNSNYPDAMSGGVNDKIGELYKWQMGWSALLNNGIIINPPLKAKLLMNYINSQGKNRIGEYFNQTAHSSGTCVDLGGGKNGVNDEVSVVKEAMKDIPEIISYVIERNNNCLHLNLKKIA